MWHFGNLCSEFYDVRDKLIEKGFYDEIYKLLQSDIIYEGLVVMSVWFFVVCSRLRQEMSEENVLKSLNVIIIYLKSNEEEVSNDCLWGLSYLSESTYSDIIRLIVESQIIEFIFTTDKFTSNMNIIPITRILGNLLSNEPYVVDYLLKIHVINVLHSFILKSCIASVRREVLWAISNICSGTQKQIFIFLNSDLALITLELMKDPNVEVSSEAIYAISSMISAGDFEISLRLVEKNLIDNILYILKYSKIADVQKSILQTTQVLLEKGYNPNYIPNVNPFAKIFAEKGGVEILDNLQYTNVDQVFTLISQIMDRFFNIDIIR